MKRYLIVGIATIVTLVVAAVVSVTVFLYRGEARVTLVNNATQAVVKGTLEVAGRLQTVRRLEPGETQQMTFQVSRDSGYIVKVTFESGREETAQVGYVTGGFTVEDTILISDEGISLGETRQVR